MAFRRVAIGAIALVMLPGCSGGSVASPPSAADPTSTTALAVSRTGAPGVGDPYFPGLGNGGYNVDHYDITLTVDPETGEITTAVTTITAAATMTLGRFDLDFSGLEVTAVTVDEAPARWDQVGQELVVTPAAAVPGGETFTVAVEYHGRPHPVLNPGVESAAGWFVGPEGLFVVAEPDAAHLWFPGNDHPTDKATFTITVTVPTGWVVASNGDLISDATTGTDTTFTWTMDSPMATYLATIAVGEYQRVETVNQTGVELRDYLPGDMAHPPPALQRVAEMIEFLEGWFGPYPFAQYGHVVVPDFPGAMEAQTMTVIGRGVINERVVVHELAHAWFGDDVSVASWSDVWLNEGFATFAEFLWEEHDQGPDAMAADIGRVYEAIGTIPHRPITNPGVAELFGIAVYQRGGLTLHALRREVGDDVMKEILTTYASRYSGGNASTDDFLAVVDEVAGRNLSTVLDPWLDQSPLPPLP